VIIAWTASCTCLYFLAFKKFYKVRVELLHEILGLDISEMGESLPEFFNDLGNDA